MNAKNRALPLIAIVLAAFGKTIMLGQIPAISMTKDGNGTMRTFMAGETKISAHSASLLRSVDNDIFSCNPVTPLTAGDVIAVQFARDQAWSVSTVPLKVGAHEIRYPLLSSVTTSIDRKTILPAILKFKVDIKVGEVVHSAGSNGASFDIETKRAVKLGDSISVLLMDGGPAILSVETADGTKSGSKIEPRLTAHLATQTPEQHHSAIEAWRLVNEHVGR